MLTNNLLIKRLSYLEKIDIATKRYEKIFNCRVPNVSGWEIGDDYKNLILSYFDYRKYGDYNPIEYVYSYDLTNEITTKLINKFGGKNTNRLLITPNNTISLVNVTNFIAKICKNKVGLLLPCYFSIPNLFINRNILFDEVPMLRIDTQYNLPITQIERQNIKTLILTNPIFSTGTYFSNEDKNYLKEYLAKGNYIIADESLAAPGKELIRILGQYENFISIYSPHKFIHLNAFKFSCVVYNKIFEDFFDQWNDVYSGSLNVTNLQAINHYISSNYEQTLKIFYEYTENKRKKLLDLLYQYPQFSTDINALGDYQTIYNYKIPYEIGNDILFIKNLIKNTQSVFYPGCLHGFQKEHGFVFRVNLLSYSKEVQVALLKILDYLSKL